MTILQLIVAALSALLLGAHLYRSGEMILAAIAVAAIALLFVRRPWAALTMQAMLVIGVFEWMRTLVVLVAMRQQYGMPFGRLAAIMIAVVGFTLMSAMLFQTRRLMTYFRVFPQSREEAG